LSKNLVMLERFLFGNGEFEDELCAVSFFALERYGSTHGFR
jgi:hypothetical protein